MCYSNNAAGLNVGPNNQLKIVDAPGLLGEYYNAYPTGDGPTCSAFDCFVNNGYQYFTATPRARYDQFIPGQRWGFNSTHNLFNMPGTEDGATGGGGGVRYTATVTPTNNPPTTLTANYVFGIVGTASPIRAYVDGVQVTSQNWPGVATNYINPVSMTVGHTYKFEFEYMEGKGGYLPEFLWWASSAVISPNDTVNGTTLAGAGTNVSQTESNKTTSVTVDSSGKFSQAGEMAGNGKFILTPTDTTYGCVCPTGCTYSGLDTPAFGKDYFIAKGFAGPPTPSPSPSPTPIPVLPWWQIDRGGDVITSGNLQSKVPSGSMFSLNGSGGFPGNNMFGGTTTLTTGNVSSQGWLGDLGSTGYQGKRYDSAYFNSIIPTNITNAMNSNLPSIATQTNFDAGTAASDGYVYFKVNGDLTMNGTLSVAGTKKIVLFVTGNLNLNGNISVGTNGQGFFMAIVGGNINVAPGVTSGANTALEGIFETDGDFSLGGGSNQLRIRGSVITYGNFILNRNTGLAPASEIVEYAPDLILLFPRALIQDTYGWSEVVP